MATKTIFLTPLPLSQVYCAGGQSDEPLLPLVLLYLDPPRSKVKWFFEKIIALNYCLLIFFYLLESFYTIT